MTVMVDQEVEALIGKLMAADERRFRQEVDADLRRPSGREPERDRRYYELRRRALRSPALIDRWYTCLSMIARSVEGQLASMQEDHEAVKADLRAEMAGCKHYTGSVPCCPPHTAGWETVKAQYSKARSGKLRFKTGLDEWVIEARALRDSLRDSMYDSIVTEERNHYAQRAQKLEAAIAEHRTSILEDDDGDPYEPSPADERLWAHLA